jgi:hypothetical protein
MFHLPEKSIDMDGIGRKPGLVVNKRRKDNPVRTSNTFIKLAWTENSSSFP